MEFIGREAQLRMLSRALTEVAVTGKGRFVLLRGRRRVGKSRLVQEFLRREGPLSLFFSASRQTPEQELGLFREAMLASDLPFARAARGARFETWEAALSLIATTAQRGVPTVLVLDELPYLIEGDPSVEGTLQKVWDRVMVDAPVLLIVIGSDISMMEALTQYGRPLFGRPTDEEVLPPLAPPELADLLGLPTAEALDAYLILGGFPSVARSWRRGVDMWTFLSEALQDPTSPLIVSGERTVAAEFPSELQARRVLSAIGAGEATFTGMRRASGVQQTSLQRALQVLTDRKSVVARSEPVSIRPSRDRRYWVADPYLRFWLRFIGPAIDEIERGRGDLALDRIRASWGSYRGRAIEPLVREAIDRMLPSAAFQDGRHVGAFWTRTGDMEVDLVLADSAPRPGRITSVGSIKWREKEKFTSRDRDALRQQASRIPGVDRRTTLIGVSRSGFATSDLDVSLGPEDIMDAWIEHPGTKT